MSHTTESNAHSYKLGAHAGYTWAARFNVPSHSHNEAVAQLGAIAQQLHDPAYGISGAMRGSEIYTSSITLGLDPSKTFGTPSIEQCEEIATELEGLPGWQRQDPRVPEHRIIMGRREGYGNDAKVYTYNETLEAGRLCLAGSKISLERAELFSVRHIPGEGLRSHHEPAVILEGGVDMLGGALVMAQTLRQDRVVSEVTNVITQVYQQQ